MNRGYIKIWRKSIDNEWLGNHKLWAFWTYCLLKASHKERTAIVGYQRVLIKPGQFVFGRRKASKDLRMHESAIRRCVAFLVNSNNISVKSTNKYSIITIINWDIYQGDKTDSDQQATNKRPTSDHRQECKALKNKDIRANFKFPQNTPLPTNIFLTDRMRAYVKKQGCENSGYAEQLFEDFKNHHGAKGTKWKDWTLVFYKWVRNDKKHYNKDKYIRYEPI